MCNVVLQINERKETKKQIKEGNCEQRNEKNNKYLSKLVIHTYTTARKAIKLRLEKGITRIRMFRTIFGTDILAYVQRTLSRYSRFHQG